MPAQWLVPSRTPFQPCRQIPLGAADIKVRTRFKPETAKLTHLNPATLRQVENHDIYAALQHSKSMAQLVLPHEGSLDNPFARLVLFEYTCLWP